MKKVIIRFKERVKTRRGYEVYYKEIPKLLLRYHFHKLAKKGCWDIEIIDIEDIAKKIDECYSINSSDIDNHIPHID